MAFEKLRKKLGKTADGSYPTDQALYARVKAEAKARFKDDWPSAYSSSWIVRTYKSRGGKYS